MLTIGLDGQRTISSAASIAARAALLGAGIGRRRGRGRRGRRPAGGGGRSSPGSRAAPPGVSTVVATGSSVIGRIGGGDAERGGERRRSRRVKGRARLSDARCARCGWRNPDRRAGTRGPAKPRDRVEGVASVAGNTPARRRVGEAGERVEHGVEVRADSQTVEIEIVGGVDDDGQVSGRAMPERAPAPSSPRRRPRQVRRSPIARVDRQVGSRQVVVETVRRST